MFYVYVYLDPRKSGKFDYENVGFLYEPFYIGKGQGDRYLRHLKSFRSKKNKYFKNKLLRIFSEFSKEDLKSYVLILRNGLLEPEAFNFERQLIKEIGRSDLNKGPLVNLTDGGDGCAGGKGSRGIRWKHSEETKQEMSKTRIGKMKPMLGKKHSEEAKAKIREGLLKKNAVAKLTKRQVCQIHMLIKLNYTIKELSNLYQIAGGTLRSIKKGITWIDIYKSFYEGKNEKI